MRTQVATGWDADPLADKQFRSLPGDRRGGISIGSFDV